MSFNTLINAIERGNLVEVIRYSRFNDISTENHALNYACSSGQLDIVKYFLEKKYDISQQEYYAFRLACEYNKINIVNYLLSVLDIKKIRPVVNYSLAECCNRHHIELAKILLEHGADVDARDNDPIKCACYKGNLELVKLLLEHGANIKLNDYAPFRYACDSGNLKLVKLLIEENGVVLNNLKHNLLTFVLYKTKKHIADYLNKRLLIEKINEIN